MTTFGDRVMELGGHPVSGGAISLNGTWFYVDGANGLASNDGLTPATPLLKISAALDKCTSGKNDVVCVLASGTAINETAVIVWNKNLTHLIGVGAPTHAAQRTRIVANATGLTPFITVAGYGCRFENVYIWQGQNEAVGNVLVLVTGQRNYFRRVHFAGGGHAAQAIDDGCSLCLNAGSENLFEDCTIGVDTVAAATGFANLLLDGYAARNVFKDCRFVVYAGSTGVRHVEVVDNEGVDRWNLFEGCVFINSCRTYALASAFVIPAGMASVTNYLLLKDCFVVGSTDWDASDRGMVYLDKGTITGGGNAGLLVVSAAA